MILVRNNIIIVDKDDPNYKPLAHFLTITEKVKKNDSYDIKPLYDIDENDSLLIYSGLNQFIPSNLPRIYEINSELSDSMDLDNFDIEEVREMSDRVILRDDQIIAINKMLRLKEGLLQLPTGIGKTEIISGFLKSINLLVSKDVPTLVLEPTIKLVTDTTARFNSYGLNARTYTSNRGEISGLVVSHPKSIINDLAKNPRLLDNVKIIIADECQHLQCMTWSTLIKALSSVEYKLGLSALVVDPGKLPISSLSRLDYTEAMVLGCTGKMIMEMKPSFYISRKILAKPILFRLLNNADENIKRVNDWTQIRKFRLESLTRSIKVAEASSFLANLGYKNLILVGTKNHAYDILEQIDRMGLGESCRCSFGGGTYFKWDRDKREPLKCNPKEEDTFNKFETGEFKILIGTSHIYEGADVPNLDSVILASIGKQPRRVIQGIGRAIRKTKKSEHGHAYIIDFTDHADAVLSKHSDDRLGVYTELVGVESTDIYSGVTFSEFKHIFYNLENTPSGVN